MVGASAFELQLSVDGKHVRGQYRPSTGAGVYTIDLAVPADFVPCQEIPDCSVAPSNGTWCGNVIYGQANVMDQCSRGAASVVSVCPNLCYEQPNYQLGTQTATCR